VAPGHSVRDVAAGTTGEACVGLVSRVGVEGRVLAVDLSRSVLSVAAEAFIASGVTR
jgi:ubiquinone/menaquinone biosynthesis C-methylase UbiE